MIIEATKPFEKSFKKLSKIDQIAVKIALGKFTIDPYDPSLKNHALK